MRTARHATPRRLPHRVARRARSGLPAQPRFCLHPIALAVLAACMSGPVLAQEAGQAQLRPPFQTQQMTPGNDLRTTTLPTVTVHARKAEERARDLPFTVNVADDTVLEQRRLDTVEAMLRSTPGLDINSFGGSDTANVRIRGVGSLYQSGLDDNSVIVHVDGMPTAPGNVTLGSLDIQQVEVLKGPQGTLFGRSSEAGAINIRSQRPLPGRFEGSVRGELGTKHHHLAEGILNAPLGETLTARLALRHSAVDYGYENRATGKPVSKPTNFAGRASLLWQPQASTDVLLRASRSSAKKYQTAMLLRPYGKPTQQDLDAGTNLDGNHRDIDQYALEIQHDLGWARLASVTGHERIDHSEHNHTGREVNLPWLGANEITDQIKVFDSKAWNQDLRLSNPKDSPVFWVAGVNLYRHDWTTAHSGFGDLRTSHDMTDDANALYGETTWPIAGTPLKLTAGARYTKVHKTLKGVYTSDAAGTQNDARDLRESNVTGRVGLGWALDAQTNLYATLAHGKKAGGFNENATSPAESAPYQAGTIDSLELGAKHESADHRLSVDAAFFFNRVSRDHLLAVDPATYASQMINVDTRSNGLELNTRWKATRSLTLQGGLAWTDGTVRSDAVTNTPAGDVKSGNRLPDVPRLSALLGVQWTQALPAFAGLNGPLLDTSLTVRHVGRRPADPQNTFDLDSYQKVDLHVGVISGNTEVYLWGDNLLNRRYDLFGYYLNSTLQVGQSALGRTVGVGVSHHF